MKRTEILKISKSPRELALQILTRLDTGHGRARDILNETIRDQGLVDPDKSFLTELVYGTIRWRGNLDWVLKQFIHPKKLKKLKPRAVVILRIGLYQLLFLNSIPEYAAVNEAVEMAKKNGYERLSGLVNAVLRKAAQSKETIPYPDIHADPVGHISARYSHPKWLVRRWIERYGVDETIRLCSANNLHAPLYIRTNILKTNRDQLIHELEEEGVEAVPGRSLSESIKIVNLPSSIDQLFSYQKGLFQVQDESSMLASHILNPQPGETIIDACAAPGGKTTHIAELMHNRGKIWAFDTDNRRLPLLAESCQRLGITIVEPVVADARNLDNYLSGKIADRVIVDAPCTGTGVMRRHLETRWRRNPEELKTFPELQYAILAGAARYVKPGGVLVYCTCSIEPEENQQVVERFLNEHPQFKIPPLQKEGNLPAVLQDSLTTEGYMQTYPHLHEMDGFFAVRMIRKINGSSD